MLLIFHFFKFATMPKINQITRCLKLDRSSVLREKRPNTVFSGPYWIQENADKKKLRIWTLFAQCRVKIINTAWKVTIFGVFRSVFSPNPRKYGPKKLLVGTLFTQWKPRRTMCKNLAISLLLLIFTWSRLCLI